MDAIFRSWEYLAELENPDWKLLASDCDFAKTICLKLANQTPDFFNDNEFPLSSMSITPGMMSRVMLYDNEKIEVRVHIFDDGAEETYIHNHGQAFITTCLQGRYKHQLWDVNGSSGHPYYIHTRQSGGIYGDTGVRGDGFVECCFSHEYACGQSFYISPTVQHTVGGASNNLVTLVIRDKKHKIDAGSTVLSLTEILAEGKDLTVQVVTDPEDGAEIIKQLYNALMSYKNAQASIACSNANFADFSPLKVSLHCYCVRRICTGLYCDI
jgi:hypothetical protein